jgi:hypothetical protein
MEYKLAGVIGLILLACLAGVSAALGVYQLRDADYFCAVDSIGRGTALVGGAEVTEARGEFKILPLGAECTFVAADGTVAVMEPGWILTVLAAGAVISGLAAIALAMWTPRQPRPATWGKKETGHEA